MTTGMGENGQEKCKGVLTQQKSKVHFYLLVITVWERQDGANTALENTHRRIQSSLSFSQSSFILTILDLLLSLYLAFPNNLSGAYVTSLREFLSSLPRFCIYCHCSSDRLCPPMQMFSTLSCSSSNSHCTTNRGATGNRKSSALKLL